MVTTIISSTREWSYTHRIGLAKIASLHLSVYLAYKGGVKDFIHDYNTTINGIRLLTVVNAAALTICHFAISKFLSFMTEGTNDKQRRLTRQESQSLEAQIESVHSQIRSINQALTRAQIKTETDVKGQEDEYNKSKDALNQSLIDMRPQIDPVIESLRKVAALNADLNVGVLIEFLIQNKVLEKDRNGMLDLKVVSANIQSIQDTMKPVREWVAQEIMKVGGDGSDKNKGDITKITEGVASLAAQNNTITERRVKIGEEEGALTQEELMKRRLLEAKRQHHQFLLQERQALVVRVGVLEQAIDLIDLTPLKKALEEARSAYEKDLKQLSDILPQVIKDDLSRAIDDDFAQLKSSLDTKRREFQETIYGISKYKIALLFYLFGLIKRKHDSIDQDRLNADSDLARRQQANEAERARIGTAQTKLKSTIVDEDGSLSAHWVGHISRSKFREKNDKIAQDMLDNTRESKLITRESELVKYFFPRLKKFLAEFIEILKDSELVKSHERDPTIGQIPILTTDQQKIVLPEWNGLKQNGMLHIENTLLPDAKILLLLLVNNIDQYCRKVKEINASLMTLQEEGKNVEAIIADLDKINPHAFKEDGEFVLKLNEFIVFLKKFHKTVQLMALQKGSLTILAKAQKAFDGKCHELETLQGELISKRKRIQQLDGETGEIQKVLREIAVCEQELTQYPLKFEALKAEDKELKATWDQNNLTIQTETTKITRLQDSLKSLKDALNRIELIEELITNPRTGLKQKLSKAQSDLTTWNEGLEGVKRETGGRDKQLPDNQELRTKLVREFSAKEPAELKKERGWVKEAPNPLRIESFLTVIRKCEHLIQLYDEKHSGYPGNWIKVHQAMEEMYLAKLALARLKKMLAYNLQRIGENGNDRAEIVEYKYRIALHQLKRYRLLKLLRWSTETSRINIKKQIIGSIFDEIKCIYKCFNCKLILKKAMADPEIKEKAEKYLKRALAAKFELALAILQIELEYRTSAEKKEKYNPLLMLAHYLELINDNNKELKIFKDNIVRAGYPNDLEKNLLGFFKDPVEENNDKYNIPGQLDSAEKISISKTVIFTQIGNLLDNMLINGTTIHQHHSRIFVIKAKINLIHHICTEKRVKGDNEKMSDYQKTKVESDKKKYRLKIDIEKAEIGGIESTARMNQYRSSVSVTDSFVDVGKTLLDPKRLIYYVPAAILYVLYSREWIPKIPPYDAYCSAPNAIVILGIMSACHFVFQSAFPNQNGSAQIS